MKNENEVFTIAAIVAGVGAIIGIGKLLQSTENLTPRLIAGRAITTAALALVAFAILAWLPDLPAEAMVGFSALIASLGEQSVEKMINRYTQQGIGDK